NGNIAIVHNGIIENYNELKSMLKDHKFNSETDSEIIAHLIEHYNKNYSYIESVKKALNKIKGSYALLILNNHNNILIAAKKSSSLVLGFDNNDIFAASDVNAFISNTNKAYFMEDGEIAVIDKGVKLFDNRGKEKKIEIKTVSVKDKNISKQGFAHFMLKEIFEQKYCLNKTLKQNKEEVLKVSKLINGYKNIILTGCGTAYHACLTSSYIFSKVRKKHVSTIQASEIINFKDILNKDTLIIAISQSGETADLLDAIKIGKEKKCKVLSIVNVEESTLARLSDKSLFINVGPEIAVASTKAFTGQVVLLMLLAYSSINKYYEGVKILNSIIKKINLIINKDLLNRVEQISKKIKQQNLFVLGKNLNYPIALESSLKIKEVSYIHAEGFAGSELKHGTLALIDKGTPCIVLCSKDDNDIINNAAEVKARGGTIIAISPFNHNIFDYFIQVPESDFQALINLIPAQLLAYYLSINRNLNPDKPKNLAKSVTVK
ncbi:glutamine--fructose-6-phosphate transaminase (isomerizing), partial [Candidatus Woesearchaeota archaeon]